MSIRKRFTIIIIFFLLLASFSIINTVEAYGDATIRNVLIYHHIQDREDEYTDYENYKDYYYDYDLYSDNGISIEFPYVWDELIESELPFKILKNNGSFVVGKGYSGEGFFYIENHSSDYNIKRLDSEEWASKSFLILKDDDPILSQVPMKTIDEKELYFINGTRFINNKKYYYTIYFFSEENKYYTLNYITYDPYNIEGEAIVYTTVFY